MGGYFNFMHLARHEPPGKAFRIEWRRGSSGFVIMAVHGGGIEPGTTELAEALAGNEHGYYSFTGLKPSGNWKLHLSSRRFDEPIGLEIARSARTVITVHGCGGRPERVYLGGRDEVLKRAIGANLSAVGFSLGEHPRFPGRSVSNICNQGKSGKGLQLELTRRLRAQLFTDLMLRDRRRANARFFQFVDAVRRGLSAPAGTAERA